MSNPVGYNSRLGIGLENTAKTRVKNQILLDFVSENVVGKGEPNVSPAVTSGRFEKKVTHGPYDWSGPVNLEVTPDKITKLLYAAMGQVSTSGTVDPFTHTFKPAATIKPVTLHIYRPGPDDAGPAEPSYFLYPGGYVDYLEFSQNEENHLALEAGFAGIGMEGIYDAAQEDVGIAYSSADPFTFSELQPSIAGTDIDITSNWKIRFANNLIRRRGSGSGRGMIRAYAGTMRVTGSLEMIFESVTQHRKFLGATANTSPIEVGTTIDLQALQLVWTKSANRVLTAKVSSGFFTVSAPAVKGRDDVIIQALDFRAIYNSGDAAPGYLTMKNGEASATISTLGTDL